MATSALQLYTDAGDAVLSDGGWLCEHATLSEDAAPARWLTDPGSTELVNCPDCNTQWVCWTMPDRLRVAKPVAAPVLAAARVMPRP